MGKNNSSSVISSATSGNECLNKTTYSAKGQISNENIVTTRDRAALVFHEYVRHREWTTDWLAYLGVFIGLLIPLITSSEFKGLVIAGSTLFNCATCRAIVLMLCVGAGALSLYCLVRRVINRKKLTCSYFLEQLRKDSVNVD